jgi:FkbM family methyltransferase
MLHHIRKMGRAGAYVDVGANIGNHTLYFALNTPSTRVFAIEPIAEAARICVNFAHMNNVGGKVTVLNVAATDEPGPLTFTGGYTSKPRPFFANGVRLDDVIPAGVAVMKIDVDVNGASAKVLKGAQRILRQDKPTLYVEALDDADLQSVMDVIEPLGYSHTGAVFHPSPTYELTAA